METKIKIVVDAMGGDYAPEVPVQGAVEALQENTNISIVLVGRTDAIKEQLAKYTYDKERIEIRAGRDHRDQAHRHEPRDLRQRCGQGREISGRCEQARDVRYVHAGGKQLNNTRSSPHCVAKGVP